MRWVERKESLAVNEILVIRLKMAKMVTNKPFYLVDRKAGPKNSVTETDVCQFISILESNIKLNENWKTLYSRTWKPKNVDYRGFTGEDKETLSANIDFMLTYMASYTPPPLLRAIVQRSCSLTEVWNLVRKWAGVHISGLKLLSYSRLQNSWDPAGDTSAAEFYYILRDCMEDTLISKDGKVKHEGQSMTKDEEMTPALESVVVKDWLVAVGGQILFEHICRVFSKDMEYETLSSIQDRISQNLDTMMLEVETQTNYVNISKTFSEFKLGSRGSQSRGRSGTRGRPRSSYSSNRSTYDQDKTKTKCCSYCRKMGRTRLMNTHTVGDCWELSRGDRADIARVQALRSEPAEDQEDEDDHDSEDSSSNQE